MARILQFTSGPSDWQVLLADPIKHWRSGFSARTLAHSWEAADGFPLEVAAAFRAASDPLVANVTPLLAIPEFKVPLPGGARSSQNDIFVLGRSDVGPVTIMVEGKVNESFGPTLDEWRTDASPGKVERLTYLLRCLGLAADPAGSVRYQLLHRAASAAITGEQFRAKAAVLLVHSFGSEPSSWADYASFVSLFGVTALRGTVQRLPGPSCVPLFSVWVTGNPEYLKS